MNAKAASEPLLSVRGLRVGFATEAGLLTAVDGIDFDIPRGRTVGIVGESGCGKSVTALSLLRLLPRPSGQFLGGEVRFEGRDLLKLPLPELEKVRGARIGMVFQEPLTALNPVHTIGRQLGETLRLHTDFSGPEITRRSVELLQQVGIPSPELRLAEYPHRLSGGMRQRVVIAIAIACGPQLLIADEPTTALDVTIQAQILSLIHELQQTMGMSVILITHDLGVIARSCDEVIVMYAGRIAEQAPVRQLFAEPRHPYTRGLLASIPRLTTPRKTPLKTIAGIVPGLRDLPPACRFENRCPHAFDRCKTETPLLRPAPDPDHRFACHLDLPVP